MLCVCCRGEGRVDLFLGHRLCRQKSTQRGQVSLKVTQWEREGDDPEVPALLQKSILVGMGTGVGRLPKNSQLGFFSEGARWVKEKWGGYRRALGGWLPRVSSCPGEGLPRERKWEPSSHFLCPELLFKDT